MSESMGLPYEEVYLRKEGILFNRQSQTSYGAAFSQNPKPLPYLLAPHPLNLLWPDLQKLPKKLRTNYF